MTAQRRWSQRKRGRSHMVPNFAQALNHVADSFVAEAVPVLTELVLYRLDSDDPDAVQSVVDDVLASIRDELLEAVALGVSGE